MFSLPNLTCYLIDDAIYLLDLMETSNTHVQRKRSYDVKSSSINYYETAQRRHSMARVHNHQVVETPIRKVDIL